MAKNKTDFSQLQTFVKNFPAIAEKMAEAAAAKSAVVLQKQMKDVMTQAGTSPSAPGNPPAIVTGNLRRSIQMQKVQEKNYKVGSALDYARFLEFGTSKMAARPWLNRSYNLAKSAMSKAASNAIKKVYRENI